MADERVRTAKVSPVAAVVIRNMLEARRARKWSAHELAGKMTAAGVTMPRHVITNLENGRRADITVDELYGLAAVFETTADYLATNVGPACTRCQDVPPAGFSCMACGAAGASPGEAEHG